MSSHLEQPVWDGNGGELDPRKATQKELLVALHVKVDSVLIPSARDHETRLRVVEDFKSRIIGAAALGALLVGTLGALIGAHVG